MANLVNFDQNGVFGPAMTLIYNAQFYNVKGISELANLLKTNFIKLTNVKPKGKKEFCTFILKKNQSESVMTPSEVIHTHFFQNMQKANPSLHHDKVLSVIVPKMLATVKEQLPNVYTENSEVKEWLARFVECYISEEQLKNQCEVQSSISEKITRERKNLGHELYKAASIRQLS